MRSSNSVHEDRVRTMLAELAEATVVDLDAIPGPARLPEAMPASGGERPTRWPWLLAAACVLVLVAVGLTVLTVRQDADRFASDPTQVPVVDTGTLGDGRLAFVLENDLYLADGATGEVRRITDTGRGEEVSHVSWSHDGEWVAFTIHDESGLWVVRRDGAERHRLGRAPSSYAWSPTENEIAYATQHEVRIARVDGSSRALEDVPPPEPYTDVLWSPDGSSVLYLGSAGLVAVSESGHTVLRDATGVVRAVAWMDDDVVLAEVRGPDNPDLGVNSMLTTIGLAEGGTRWLLTFNELEVAVSADRRLLVVMDQGSGAAYRCPKDIAGCWLLPVRGSSPALSHDGGWLAVVDGASELSVVETGPVPPGEVEHYEHRELGSIGGGLRGHLEIDGATYSVVPEPPVWIGTEALLVRVDERALVRIDVESGQRTTVVAGPRFRPPADNYPGGVGFAYWQPR